MFCSFSSYTFRYGARLLPTAGGIFQERSYLLAAMTVEEITTGLTVGDVIIHGNISTEGDDENMHLIRFHGGNEAMAGPGIYPQRLH